MRSQILERMNMEAPAGIWTPNDFTDLGPRSAVDMALSRLAADGTIRRFARGLYDRPRVNPLTKRPTTPSPNKIVEAIARRDGLKYVVDGLTAANDLGFDDAVPARIVVHTNARLSPIHVGSLDIEFKLTLGPRMFWAGRPAMRLVQALHWLKDRIPRDGDRILRRVETLLDDADTGSALQLDLLENIHILPTWMQNFLRPALSPTFDDRVETPGPRP